MNETAKCQMCGNANQVLVASGHKKPENKGKKYFTCAGCGAFQWVENGNPVHSSGLQIDYSKMPDRAPKPQNTQPDWDAIAEGKVRHGVAVAFITRGEDFGDNIEFEMSKWVNWIMNGSKT